MLPNLELQHRELAAALRRSGDIMAIARVAASYAGLSKNLELDMSWMAEDDRQAIERAKYDVVVLADRVHRLAYEVLSGTGRA